jgi:hypothetical protein
MQLKLDLFEENLGTCLDDYLDNRGYLKQIQLQTGKPRGTFKQGDPHPNIPGLFFNRFRWNKEHWIEKKNLEKLQNQNYSYRKTERGKKVRKDWRQGEKRLQWLNKYYKSTKGKARSRYYNSQRRTKQREASKQNSLKDKKIIQHYYTWSVRLENKLGIKFHVDHIVPVSKGGLHHHSNLQVVPASWNISKHNRNTERWLPNGL